MGGVILVHHGVDHGLPHRLFRKGELPSVQVRVHVRDESHDAASLPVYGSEGPFFMQDAAVFAEEARTDVCLREPVFRAIHEHEHRGVGIAAVRRHLHALQELLVPGPLFPCLFHRAPVSAQRIRIQPPPPCADGLLRVPCCAFRAPVIVCLCLCMHLFPRPIWIASAERIGALLKRWATLFI